MVAIEASAAPRVRRAAELVQYMQQRGYTVRYTGKHTIGEGMPLLMVHEQRDGKGAVPFGQIIAGTPRPRCATSTTASWRRRCTTATSCSACACACSSARWPCPAGGHARTSAPPALLEMSSNV